LKRAPALAIWTAPPSREDLLDALETVNPERVVLFGVNPDTDSVQGFLKRFGGVIKHVLNSKNGQTTSEALCGVMAHSPETINAALQWMVARGHIRITGDENGHLMLTAGGQEDRDAFAATSTQLAQRIQEAAGFRAYFRRADAQSLLMSDTAPE
jgi:hypothetical protein